MNKVQRILNFAMRMEKDAHDFYSYYMDKVDSDSTRELFGELAEIEKSHYEVLRNKFEQLSFREPPVAISWVVDDSFASKDPHILADSSDILGNMPDDASDLTIIRMAYLIENDFAEFYTHAMETVDNKDARDFLGMLAEWEGRHRDMFNTRYKSLLKKYWEDISAIMYIEK